MGRINFLKLRPDLPNQGRSANGLGTARRAARLPDPSARRGLSVRLLDAPVVLAKTPAPMSGPHKINVWLVLSYGLRNGGFEPPGRWSDKPESSCPVSQFVIPAKADQALDLAHSQNPGLKYKRGGGGPGRPASLQPGRKIHQAIRFAGIQELCPTKPIAG